MKLLLRLAASLACLTAFAAALVHVWPHARDAVAIFAAQDDPALLSELQIRKAVAVDPLLLEREIVAALASADFDLAQSFADLAQAQNVPISVDVLAQLDEAAARSRSMTHLAGRFATGFLTGTTDDVASLSGTVAGDLFTFGDIRDLVREGRHLVLGDEPDRLVLGLAAAGLAVTAGTYASAGAASPARAGLSLLKGARKSARLSAGLSDWARRSASEVVDTGVLRRAVADVSLTRPMQSFGALKAAVKTEKAALLVTAVKDVGRVGEKAGARAALDIMKVADNPKELARAARLAESRGSQTRAILKILGRGALFLAAGAFNLASWLFSALVFLLGVVASIKSLTERLTMAWLRRARARRACADAFA
ncbi:hypothetical protein [Bradyrhizobium sp. LHD-71]|uniref:hypothetical protein n=1 Tax=Bradyrhizobium sp. LHD-71 TaxID=3072141 RepID=UPI00280E31F7|nr:hypothetical protein [Bradyrhizobium sp. LHD-71]MDQ8726575.1 hypothetical protein [Bradyrhizobium sp. LHD-71]